MNRPSRIALTICALAGLSLAIAAAVSAGADSPRATAPSCTVAALARARHLPLFRCADGWALAAGRDIGVFRQDRRRWVERMLYAPGNPADPGLYQFADAGISPHLMLRLARSLPLRVRRVADAGALVEELAAHEVVLKTPGSYRTSLVRAAGETWFVLAGANAPIDDNGSVTASPYPDGTLWVYRWSASGWSKQGTVEGWMGPIFGCCGISPVFLTGSHDPDFAVTGGGAADTNWLSIASDIGGHWHLVPFDYGFTDTTVVNGLPTSKGVQTEIDASGAAGGPTTWLFETYREGAFRPANPPGSLPSCGLQGLQAAADAGRAGSVEFTGSACADGWAIAVGDSGQVVGLFDADSYHASRDNAAKWGVVELDNGASLGSDPGIYDIPLSLLRRLAARFGPALQPEIAIAPLIATDAMTGWPYVSGVVSGGGAQWFIAEKPTGDASNPGADATVYSWSGSAWQRQGVVDNIPASLSYYDLSGIPISFGHFEAVDVAGATDPGFILEGGRSSHPDVLTDAGGSWHSAPLSP